LLKVENPTEKSVPEFESVKTESAANDPNREDPLPVIIDLGRVVDIDFTAAVVSHRVVLHHVVLHRVVWYHMVAIWYYTMWFSTMWYYISGLCQYF
jgi:hypothetical protein